MVAVEDYIIPSLWLMAEDAKNLCNIEADEFVDLNWMSRFTKETGFQPTLVSTGMKCKLDSGTWLQLSIRSSSPLKHWIMLANGIGVIDKDYYNNPSNEGEIFFQIYNLSPFNIKISKGDAIGQAIIMPYTVTEDDIVTGERTGGFGSTNG
jgi:dUTP pyrophosphatase